MYIPYHLHISPPWQPLRSVKSREVPIIPNTFQSVSYELIYPYCHCRGTNGPVFVMALVFVSEKIELACFDTMCARIATLESQKNAQFRLNLLSARAHARANISAHARIYPLAEMNTDAPIINSLVIIFFGNNEKVKK